jgi:pyruvate dehydrogenase E2 component (dihydrolipoamide acetyltransferase)
MEIDFTNGQNFLNRVNKTSKAKITVTHLVAKAAAMTLRHFPDINGLIRWRRIYLRDTVDIFIQVAVPGEREEKADLSGAKVDACDTKTLEGIATELREKSQAIRRRQDPQFVGTLSFLDRIPSFLLPWLIKLMGFLIHDLGFHSKRLGLPEDPFGSAMVTSMGSLGIQAAYAPLVPMSRTPLIVCVGEVRQKPWVVEGQVVARPILDLGVTFDHRFMDGLTASLMAKYFSRILEDPEKFL